VFPEPGDMAGTTLRPAAIYQVRGGRLRRQAWKGDFPVTLSERSLAILEWQVASDFGRRRASCRLTPLGRRRSDMNLSMRCRAMIDYAYRLLFVALALSAVGAAWAAPASQPIAVDKRGLPPRSVMERVPDRPIPSAAHQCASGPPASCRVADGG